MGKGWCRQLARF